MPRVWLREDHPWGGDVGGSAPVALDEDRPGGRCRPCTPCQPDSDGPYGVGMVVSLRTAEYLDVNGDTRYGWDDYPTTALLTGERVETSDADGQTRHTATVTASWPADRPVVAETAELVDHTGNRWAVTAVAYLPGAVRLTVGRVEHHGA